MKARAPGKLVLSGAYVVLDGAPAVVAAVSLYAVADTERHPRRVSPEFRAAFGARRPPLVDTASMRRGGRKLGVGSSSAATVAAIAADRWSVLPDGDAGRAIPSIATAAYDAHRAAQGGGSGIDVIACSFGGISICMRNADGGLPQHVPSALPEGLVMKAYACPDSASTSALVQRVRALRASDAARYDALTRGAVDGAARFRQALLDGDAAGALEGARLQRDAMEALGDASGAPILPDYLRRAHVEAAARGAVFAQSGAGGGDVALWFGPEAPSISLERGFSSLGLAALTLTFGVPGVSPVDG